MNTLKSKILIAGIFISLSSAAFCTGTNSATPTAAGSCPLEAIQEANANQTDYEVFSPVGNSAITPVTQAPRLASLEGKTVAVVGGSFMAHITHPEIKRLILKHFPEAKVILLNEIGSAGPYPQPGVVRQQTEDFKHKLQEMKVDAVISGNGGCGLCTPKEEGSCIVAEKLGIPCVMITAPGFKEQAKTVALAAGISVQRIAEYPGAFSAHTPQELLENTQTILWPQIVSGLTTPISNEEIQQNTPKETLPEAIAYAGSYEEVSAYFHKQGWTDGLPVVPPTKKRVEEFLKYTDLPAHQKIGDIPIAYRTVTPFQVAVVGAMSGCNPEYMPILIAYAQAMLDGNFRKTLSSTHAWTPFIWLNGPLARQLGIDAKQGAISAANNKKIGRFIDLAMINLGGYDIKKNRMGTFGYLSSWSLAEDESAALQIGWQPYHVQQGFSLNDNTLTAASALSWGNNLTPATSDAEKIMELMAWDAVEKEQFALGAGTPFVYRTVLITPYVARDLSVRYPNKETLEKALAETARRPLEERAYANYWANPGSSFEGKNYSLKQHTEKIARAESAQDTATPSWLEWSGKKTLATVPVMQPGKTAILVLGDESRNKTMTLPGGAPVTLEIKLPKNWDALMQQLGYEPLASFYLKETPRVQKPQTTPGNKAVPPQSASSARTRVQPQRTKTNRRPSAARRRKRPTQ